MKNSTRNIIKQQKGIVESTDLRANCKKCNYYGTNSKVCQIHLLKTKNTEVCSDYTSQRRAMVYAGGVASPR